MKFIEKNKHTSYSYLVILLIVGACIALAGYQYHKNFEKHFRTIVENQLKSIVDLKVGELEHWLEERRGDGKTLLGNKVFSEDVKRYFKNPNDHTVKSEIQGWMNEFLYGYNYDAIILTDHQFVKRIVIPETTERPRAFISPENIDSIKAGKLVFEDFYYDDVKHKVFLKVLIPILDIRQLIGIIELRIDPKTYLYPTLKTWPIPGNTSESFILRREGNRAVYLSELKFQKNAVLNLRVPLEDTRAPAVRVILGYNGFMEGIDYRGKAVVAHIDRIPNSPWYMVTKSDKSEVYAPLRENLRQTVIFGLLMFLLTCFGLRFLWRNQRALFHKERIKSTDALRNSEERFRMLFDKAPLSYQSLDINGNLIDVNQTWLDTFGYDQEEVLGNWFGNFIAPDWVDGFKERFPLLIANEKMYAEFEMIHNDGTYRFVSAEGRVAKDLDGNFIQIHTILQDITELKKSELERQVIYEITQGVSTTANLNELLKLIHQSLGKVLFTDNYFVALHDQNTGLFSFPYYIDQFDTTPDPSEMAKSCTAYVFRTGKPILITPEIFRQLKEQNEVELVGLPSPSWIGVPLQIPTRTIGVLVLQHYEKENVYSERDVQFLDTVGSQIALVIERKLTEEAIRREMDFSQATIDSLPGFFYLIDNQGKFLRWNTNVEKITGYTAEEIANLSPLDFFDEPDKMFMAEKIQLVFQIGESNNETDLLLKDKTKIPIFITGKRFMFENKLCIIGIGIDISDRMQSEENLRNAHLLLRTVIDNIPDSIYCKDIACRKILANRTELSYSGANSEADIIGKTDFDLYPKEIAQGFFADDQMVLREGKSVLNREEYIIDDSDQKHWLLTSKLPIKDEHGIITGLVGIGRDITERRQAEENLRESEIKLNVILQSTADGILAVDANGKVIKTNQRFADLWCIPQSLIDSGDDDALIRFIFEQLTNPNEFISKVQKLYNSTDEDLDFLHFKDGRTFERYSAPMVMNDSSVGRVWSFRDITERKQIEEALKESEKKFRLLIENQGEGLTIVDPDENLLFVNPAAESIFGVEPGMLAGQNLKKFIALDQFDQVLMETGKRKKNKKSTYELDIVTPSGIRRNILVTATPQNDENGKFIGTFGVLRDITERKRAEKEIFEANIQLSKTNAEKDKFFSIIAHDLRSPFNSFLGLTQIMAEELPGLSMTEIQDIAITLKNSATNLFSLLENLLKWSLMQRGLISYNPEVMLLKPMVDECLAISFDPAKNKGIDLISDIPDNILVIVDLNMLQTIIRNLISNAIKFTPKGGKIDVLAKKTDHNEVEISIKDTGIGMNPNMVANLFRIDVQTSRNGTDGEPSTGLGLLLCKEFVEKHGGRLWVESDPEGKSGTKGSVFSFTIPNY